MVYLVCGARCHYLLWSHAQDKQTFDQEVDDADWDNLLQKVPVKAGDFFYVPAGTLHALVRVF